MTPGKLAFLETLEREIVEDRPRGPVGRNCMVNGWTDWATRGPDGKLVPWRDLTRTERNSGDFIQIGEMLTPKGRRRLAEYRRTGR